MNTLKVEFWLCLAHAFLPPLTESARAALRDYLANDLEELARALDYPIAADLDAFRRAIAAVPAGEAPLALYSRLFLVPGVAHPHINAAAYFDGATHGGTLRQLVECYRACGLEKGESLADLPDHVAAQLEFTAWLFAAAAAREAGEAAPSPPLDAAAFIAAFVARWAPPFRRDLELAGERFALATNPWLHLARMLESAARREAAAANRVADNLPSPDDDDIARLRRHYAGHTPDAADLARIRASLATDGLASDHIGLPPEARDGAAGLTRMYPPAPPRHSLPGA